LAGGFPGRTMPAIGWAFLIRTGRWRADLGRRGLARAGSAAGRPAASLRAAHKGAGARPARRRADGNTSVTRAGRPRAAEAMRADLRDRRDRAGRHRRTMAPAAGGATDRRRATGALSPMDGPSPRRDRMPLRGATRRRGPIRARAIPAEARTIPAGGRVLQEAGPDPPVGTRAVADTRAVAADTTGEEIATPILAADERR
jgi:hypothetical protein